MTLAKRIAELVEVHGSLREVARLIGIDVGYLSRLSRGEKSAPSAECLKRLGLRAVVTYEPIRKRKAKALFAGSGYEVEAFCDASD